MSCALSAIASMKQFGHSFSFEAWTLWKDLPYNIWHCHSFVLLENWSSTILAWIVFHKFSPLQCGFYGLNPEWSFLVVEWVTCSLGTPLTQVQSLVGGYIVTRMITIMVVLCQWHVDKRSSPSLGQNNRSKHDCPSMTLGGWCGRLTNPITN